MRKHKIGLIGGGQIGGNLALLAVAEVARERAALRHPRGGGAHQGKALDINQLKRSTATTGRVTRVDQPADLAAATSSSSPPECRESPACRAKTCSTSSKIIKTSHEHQAALLRARFSSTSRTRRRDGVSR